MVSMGVSKLRKTDPIFVDPRVKIDGKFYQTKVHDTGELKQRMLDVCRRGLEQNVISDAINEWRKCLRTCVCGKNILSIYFDSRLNTC